MPHPRLHADLVCCHCARDLGEVEWALHTPEQLRFHAPRGQRRASAVWARGGVRCGHCHGPVDVQNVRTGPPSPAPSPAGLRLA